MLELKQLKAVVGGCSCECTVAPQTGRNAPQKIGIGPARSAGECDSKCESRYGSRVVGTRCR